MPTPKSSWPYDIVQHLRQPFFDRYQEHRPIAEILDTRRLIYNLYPLLVHVYLFGAGYVPRSTPCSAA